LSICNQVIIYAKKLGIDECESIFCSKKIITIRITDSEIAEIKENYDQSIAVRLIRDKKISSAQSRMLDSQRIVDDAIKSTNQLTKREFWKTFPCDTKSHPILEKTNDSRLWQIDSSAASDIAQTMINSANNRKITRISGSLNIVCEEFELQNTSGLQKSDKATYITGIINADSEQGSFPVSGIGQANSRILADFDAQNAGFEAAQMCINSLNPQNCESQITSVVFEPFAAGELLSFVFAPNFDLKTYSEKRSCFSEKNGTKIASDGFSLLDEPHAANRLGSKSFDDEGVPTDTIHYIKNGIFENTYSDSYNAFKENSVSSGNARRPGSPLGRSTEPIPITAPHNLTIKSGSQTRDEIIKDTKNGILVSRLWYTYPVNPIKGDFSCTARSGIWIIKNGELVFPAKPLRIIHNLPLLLQKISGIAKNERQVLPWAALPVISPTIKCDDILINSI
jgi:PmbA protein